MKKLDHTSHQVCVKCGFVFFQNSKPTASPLITNEKDEVLLVQRAIQPHLGKWDIPGGFLDNGEDPIAGLRRETREELSVEIEPGEIVSIYVDDYPYDEGELYTLNLFYRCKIISGEIKVDSENSQAKWFSKVEIPWNQLAFKNTEIALKKLFNI